MEKNPFRKLRAPGEAGAGAEKIQWQPAWKAFGQCASFLDLLEVVEAEPPREAGAGAGAEKAQQQPTWRAFSHLR
jgi:hypothetical protein